MPVTILHTRDGRLDDADRRALAALEERVKSGSPKILLHLHGGLVDETAGVAAATRLSGKGDKAFEVPEEWEQIYIVWRTGMLEQLRTNWRDIFENDRLYRTLLRRLLSVLSKKIGLPAEQGRSVGEVVGLTPAEVDRRLREGSDQPFSDIDARIGTQGSSSRAAVSVPDEAEVESEVQDALSRDADLETVAADIEAALTQNQASATRSYQNGDPEKGEVTLAKIDDRISAEWKPEQNAGRSIAGAKILWSLAKHGAAIAKRVIKRYRASKDHGLHATIVEELVREFYGSLIGSIVWKMMKDDASDHFRTGLLGDDLLRIFASNASRRLLVTAHSAGSIWASEMLLAAERKGQTFPVDLLFLAPAVRATKFAQVLAVKGDQIGKFRMYAMQDTLERADVLLGPGTGFLYPSSLLYFVSGLCEEDDHDAELANAPLLGMARFLDGATPWLADPSEGPALQAIHAFLGQGDKRAIFSKSSAGPGLNTESVSHGGFDDDPATLKSIRTFFP